MASEAAYRERLLNPKPDEVETHLGGFLPGSLIEMYADKDLIQHETLELHSPKGSVDNNFEWIEAFLSLDVESQKYTCDLAELGWGKGSNFAADGCGNFYWVPVDAIRKNDAPVYFACHDPWGNEKIAESLREFLSWPRGHIERKR